MADEDFVIDSLTDALAYLRIALSAVPSAILKILLERP